MVDEYLHDADIARMLRIAVTSLRNKISAGDPLPPHVSLPGIRARLWRRDEVEQWFEQFDPKSGFDGERRGRK